MLDIEVLTKKLINLRFWLLTEIKTIIWLFSISINFAIVTFVITELHIVCNICITQSHVFVYFSMSEPAGELQKTEHLPCPLQPEHLHVMELLLTGRFSLFSCNYGGRIWSLSAPQHDQYLVSVLETTSLMINIVYRSTQLRAHHCNITLVVLQSTYDSILLNQLKLSLLQLGGVTGDRWYW